MDHYVDIDLRSDPEFPAYQLMSALYGKLHRALVAVGSTRIGTSFPYVNEGAGNLGTRLRLHGKQESLVMLLESGWLVGIRDHVTLSSPASVPPGAKYRIVRRIQAKSNVERLRRRLMRRHELDSEEAARRIPETAARYLNLPFVQLRSASTGQPYSLFIEHGPLLAEAVPGNFNTFGLSQTATVPWF
jgi:CRISPR-associated endonuclease Csy4